MIYINTRTPKPYLSTYSSLFFDWFCEDDNMITKPRVKLNYWAK